MKRLTRPAAVCVGMALIAGFLVAGSRVDPAPQVELAGSGAWLASAEGLLTLLDGSSDEVVGSARVAPPGSNLQAVQSGSSAYVVNQSAGAVVRVDGSTYARSDSVRFTGGPSDSLQLFAQERAVYVIDGQRAQAALAEPRTLRLLDERVPLAAEPAEGQAVVDPTGRLIVLDRDSGDLVTLGGEGTGLAADGVTRGSLAADRKLRRNAVAPGSRLVVAGKRVVSVGRDGRLGLLSGGGFDEAACDLDTRARETVRLSGATQSPILFATVGDRGTVLIANLDDGANCVRAVNVAEPGNRLGRVVEAMGVLFAPNLSRGTALVIHPASATVIAEVDLKLPGADVELLPTPGAVMYNDPLSEKAGVIRLSEGQWRSTAVPKYDPRDPGAALLDPADDPSNTREDKSDPPPVTDPGKPLTEPELESRRREQVDPGATPTALPSQPTIGPTGSPSPGLPTGTVSPVPPTGTVPTQEPPTAPTLGTGRLLLNVVGEGLGSVSPRPTPLPEGTPESCEDVGVNDPGPGCVFDYPGLSGPTQVTLSADRPADSATLTWAGCLAAANASTCVVTLNPARTAEITTTFETGGGGSDEVTLTTQAGSGGALDVRPAGGGVLNCAEGCPFPAGTEVTLVARPTAGHLLAGNWGPTGGCDAEKLECPITIRTDMTAAVSFVPIHALTVQISGTGTVRGTDSTTGDWSCTSTCIQNYRGDALAGLSVADTDLFVDWSGACSGPCSVAMTADREVQVSFRPDPTPPDVTLTYFDNSAGRSRSSNPDEWASGSALGNGTFNFTAVGTDSGSKLGRTEIRWEGRARCFNSSEFRDVSSGGPAVASNSGEVVLPMNFYSGLGCPTATDLADLRFFATTRSGGGTATTLELRVQFAAIG